MYVYKSGGWLKNPFLRGRFLLTDPADLKAIVECKIVTVWIDSARAIAQPGVLNAAEKS